MSDIQLGESESAIAIKRNAGASIAQRVKKTQSGKGPIFAMLGDSFFEQCSRLARPPAALPASVWYCDGWATWLRVLSDQRINLPIEYNFGVSGNNFVEMLARVKSVLESKATFCFVNGGTNDFKFFTFEQICLNWMALIETIRNAGITPIILPAAPRGDGLLTAAEIKKQWRFYNFQREYCLKNEGYLFCDYIGYWLDQASATSAPITGRARADNIHPSSTGAYYMGKAAYDLIAQFLPPIPTALLPMTDIYDAVNNPTGNLLYTGGTNIGVLSGTTGNKIAGGGLTYVGNLATGCAYFRTGTSVCTVTLTKENPRTDAGRSSGERQIVRIQADATGGADEVHSIRFVPAMADIAAGDWYYAEMSVEVSIPALTLTGLEMYLLESRPSNSQAAMDMAMSGFSGFMPNAPWKGVYRTPPILRTTDATSILLDIRARFVASVTPTDFEFKIGDVVLRKVAKDIQR